MRWPALTILGITCAVLIGITHASFKALGACILGYDELTEDGFAADGYGNR